MRTIAARLLYVARFALAVVSLASFLIAAVLVALAAVSLLVPLGVLLVQRGLRRTLAVSAPTVAAIGAAGYGVVEAHGSRLVHVGQDRLGNRGAQARAHRPRGARHDRHRLGRAPCLGSPVTSTSSPARASARSAVRVSWRSYAVSASPCQASARFGQSIANAGQTPRAYDILTCLTKYDPGTFENFCSDFG